MKTNPHLVKAFYKTTTGEILYAKSSCYNPYGVHTTSRRDLATSWATLEDAQKWVSARTKCPQQWGYLNEIEGEQK